jgi:hypothetical protein
MSKVDQSLIPESIHLPLLLVELAAYVDRTSPSDIKSYTSKTGISIRKYPQNMLIEECQYQSLCPSCRFVSIEVWPQQPGG